MDCEERAEDCWELRDRDDQPCTCPCHKSEAEDFYHASGSMVCERCSKPYRQHPLGGPIGMDERRFLRRLCDGSLVKL